MQLFFILFGIPFLPIVVAAESLSDYSLELEELRLEPRPSFIAAVAAFGHQLYVIDSEVHELLIYRNGRLVRTAGGIGNRPGEFFYPYDIYVADSDRLLVLDGGNHRLQILSSRGRHVGHVSGFPKPWGLAANQSTIFLGQPDRQYLVSAYHQDGELSKTFGELLSPTALWGDQRGVEEGARSALNRIHMTADHDSNLWVVFQHAPLVRKYDPQGRLLLEQRIEVPGLEVLEEAVASRSKAPGASSMSIDGVQLTVVVHDIVFDQSTGLLAVLLGDQRLLAMDQQARLRYLVDVPGRTGHVQHLAQSAGSGLLIASSSSLFVTQIAKGPN